MAKRKPLFAVFVAGIMALMFFTEGRAQVGGQSTYSFLNTTPSARIAAVGGYQPGLNTEDLTLSYKNPALIDSNVNRYATVSYGRHIADINKGVLSHAREVEGRGTFQGNLQYIDYGTFQRADAFGNKTGEFRAGEFALSLGHARGFGDFRVGANAKLIYSALESYHSMGIAIDAGGFYFNEDNELGVGLVVQNLGTQIFSHTGNGLEPLPLDINLGATKKLLNAPFRFTLVAHSLQSPDLTFESTETVQNLQTGEVDEEGPSLSNRIFKHFTFATELVLSENLQLRVGYNHQRREELQLENIAGMSGFSWGFGIGISRFKVDFSRATYNPVGTTHQLTVSTNMEDWITSE